MTSVPQPVNAYLSDIAKYYKIGEEARRQSEPVYDRPLLGTAFIPPILVGAGGASRDITVLGGPDVMDRARQYNREDRDEDRSTKAAWIFGIITVVGAAIYAFFARNWCDDKKALNEARQFKNEIIPLQDRPLQTELIPIVNKHIEILEAKTARSRNIVVISSAGLASAVTGFVAGMLAIQWLITTAIIVGVATLAIGAFATVWHCTEKTDMPANIQEQIESLRNRFR